MKGLTNLMFFYQNNKFSESYLDNMYRIDLRNGKCLAECKLNSYQEHLTTLASKDEMKDNKVYNFFEDKFEDKSYLTEIYSSRERKDYVDVIESFIDKILNLDYKFKEITMKYLILTLITITSIISSIVIKNSFNLMIINNLNVVILLFLLQTSTDYCFNSKYENKSILKNRKLTCILNNIKLKKA